MPAPSTTLKHTTYKTTTARPAEVTTAKSPTGATVQATRVNSDTTSGSATGAIIPAVFTNTNQTTGSTIGAAVPGRYSVLSTTAVFGTNHTIQYVTYQEGSVNKVL